MSIYYLGGTDLDRLLPQLINGKNKKHTPRGKDSITELMISYDGEKTYDKHTPVIIPFDQAILFAIYSVCIDHRDIGIDKYLFEIETGELLGILGIDHGSPLADIILQSVDKMTHCTMRFVSDGKEYECRLVEEYDRTAQVITYHGMPLPLSYGLKYDRGTTCPADYMKPMGLFPETMETIVVRLYMMYRWKKATRMQHACIKFEDEESPKAGMLPKVMPEKEYGWKSNDETAAAALAEAKQVYKDTAYLIRSELVEKHLVYRQNRVRVWDDCVYFFPVK